MRYCVSLLMLASLAFGQTSSSLKSAIPGLDGVPVDGPTFQTSKSATGSARIEYSTSINGQLAPRESIEEKVIREDANGKVVERYVRRFDATGNPGPVEKTVIEERKSGSTTVTTSTVYRGDLNGNLTPAERSVAQAVEQGKTIQTNVVIERSGFDGQMTPVERIAQTTVQNSKESQQQTTTRMRRDANGNFYEAVREVRETMSPKDGPVVENRAQYVDGALAEQTVARTVKQPNGSRTTVIDVYATQQPGVSADVGGRLALKEQQQIVREVGAGGKTATETVISRKPNVSDPGRLGPAQVLSRTTCAGTGCRD
ncbi:hypothetical protein F183_A42170 [Bryobacterales bacterium F-183]|nr:hypothetical protein F183_A42170 [Bryobacterales bacterium F-183]